ncbi:HEAT repeat domain-containing protein [Halosimplex sp. TS25]|uniref:HEAT repeat domain-containing protein n=1 Tax=Halosimplex rarum TaxID=3396619 RepID=UPI0039ECC20B
MTERPEQLRDRATVAPEAVAGSLEAFPREAGVVGETLRSFEGERRSAAVAAVAARLTDDDVIVRRGAALALRTCFEVHPETDPAVATELARSLADDDHVVRKHAGTALRDVAVQDPETADAAVDSLPELLDPASPDLLSVGLDIAAVVAESDPDAAVPLVPPLLDALDALADSAAGQSGGSDDVTARSPAAREFRRRQATELGRQRDRIVGVVNETLGARPEAVSSVRPALVDALRSESVGVARATLAETLGQVAESDPAAAAGTTDDLAALLDDADAAVATSAAWALGILADTHGQRVADAVAADVDALAALLDAEAPGARVASATLLAYVAENRPDAVDPAIDSLVAALDDANPDVRASAVLALGDAGTERALADLRTVATDDPDERVQTTAQTVLGRIAADE